MEGYAVASVYRSAPAGTIYGRRSEPPRLLDRLRFTLRAKHHAYRTERRVWRAESARRLGAVDADGELPPARCADEGSPPLVLGYLDDPSLPRGKLQLRQGTVVREWPEGAAARFVDSVDPPSFG